MRRFLTGSLCLLLGVSMSFAPNAEEVYTEGYFQYTIQGDVISICNYFGSDTSVTVPQAIAGIPVANIETGAFDNTPVQTVTLPSSVQNIEEGSFASSVQIVSASSATTTPTPATPEAPSFSTAPPNSDSTISIQQSTVESTPSSASASAEPQPVEKSPAPVPDAHVGVSQGGQTITVTADGKLLQNAAVAAPLSSWQASSATGQADPTPVPEDMTLEEFVGAMSDAVMKDEVVKIHITPGGAGFLAGLGSILVLGGIAAFIVTRKERKNGPRSAAPTQKPEIQLDLNNRRRRR